MISPEPSSFRDPAAQVVQINGVVHRRIFFSYKLHYNQLMSSGLYQLLTDKGQLVRHEEINHNDAVCYKLIRPTPIPWINYPYEWTFSQLKAAALLTLRIQKTCMDHGMSLKDATGFNLMFIGASPNFIDTSSFEIYDETKPWIAYQQFCSCFLAPLLLFAYKGTAVQRLLQIYPEGIPIHICAALLPVNSRFRMLPLLHIHMQNSLSTKKSRPRTTFNKTKLLRIIQHLEDGIERLHLKKPDSHWDNYYEETVLSPAYLGEKKKIVTDLLSGLSFETVIDLGANTGEFSLALGAAGKSVLAVDEDSNCVERLFKTSGAMPITALVIDLMNPSPAIGWRNRERNSFTERAKADLVLALALVHHICISKNLPLKLFVEGLSFMGEWLLIEFVPKSDPRVAEILQDREYIFDQYSEEKFVEAITEYYQITSKQLLPHSSRKLFLCRKK